jgi:hypothetical protein
MSPIASSIRIVVVLPSVPPPFRRAFASRPSVAPIIRSGFTNCQTERRGAQNCALRRNAGQAQRVLPLNQGILAAAPDRQPPEQVGWEPMRIELYRVIHWVAIVALVVWAVYSAYSAFIFS